MNWLEKARLNIETLLIYMDYYILNYYYVESSCQVAKRHQGKDNNEGRIFWASGNCEICRSHIVKEN